MKNIILSLALVLSSAGTVAGQFLFKGTAVFGSGTDHTAPGAPVVNEHGGHAADSVSTDAEEEFIVIMSYGHGRSLPIPKPYIKHTVGAQLIFPVQGNGAPGTAFSYTLNIGKRYYYSRNIQNLLFRNLTFRLTGAVTDWRLKEVTLYPTIGKSHYFLKVGKQRMGVYERVGYYCHFDNGFNKVMANGAALSGGIHLGRYRIWKYLDIDISTGYNWFPGQSRLNHFNIFTLNFLTLKRWYSNDHKGILMGY